MIKLFDEIHKTCVGYRLSRRSWGQGLHHRRKYVHNQGQCPLHVGDHRQAVKGRCFLHYHLSAGGVRALERSRKKECGIVLLPFAYAVEKFYEEYLQYSVYAMSEDNTRALKFRKKILEKMEKSSSRMEVFYFT